MSTVAVADMTQDEAREFIAYVRNQQRELPKRIRDAWHRRAWIALGYQSWDTMCVAERIQLRGLPRDERQEMVLDLRAAGMSTRAIGSALGVSHPTVLNDLPTGGQDLPPVNTVRGLDDGVYQPSRPVPEPDPLPEPIAEQIQRRNGQRQTEPEVWTPAEIALRERLENGQTVVVTQRGEHDRLIGWAIDQNAYVRIDRRTEWGNPFETPADGDRAAVIAHYRDHYLPYKPSLDRKRDLLTGKALGCWCAPEPCHGDVLAEWADSRSA